MTPPRTVASHADAGRARPTWPADPLCLQPSRRVPPRLLAAALLSLLATRLALHMAARSASGPPGGFTFPVTAAVGLLILGGCLWWVAKRQIGLSGAIIALALFVTAPLTQVAACTALASLGVFGMVYTSVGVAHALQGPRRKWPPRIAMLAALAAFTGGCNLHAASAALGLMLLAMLYLAERRRLLLVPLLLLWTACSAAGWAIVRVQRWPIHIAAGSATPPGLPLAWHAASWHAGFIPLALAVAAALLGWATSRRSRYFGNSAPMLAAVLLLCLLHVAGSPVFAWALPFALLFVAGVWADRLAPLR